MLHDHKVFPALPSDAEQYLWKSETHFRTLKHIFNVKLSSEKYKLISTTYIFQMYIMKI